MRKYGLLHLKENNNFFKIHMVIIEVVHVCVCIFLCTFIHTYMYTCIFKCNQNIFKCCRYEHSYIYIYIYTRVSFFRASDIGNLASISMTFSLFFASAQFWCFVFLYILTDSFYFFLWCLFHLKSEWCRDILSLDFYWYLFFDDSQEDLDCDVFATFS
jgi:hypothetical protein